MDDHPILVWRLVCGGLIATLVGCTSGLVTDEDCLDEDGDGYGRGGGCLAADCNDTDALHWDDCRSCSDGDGDGRGPGCNPGGDCEPAHPAHWSDCGACVDADLDGFGAACNLGPDCDDANPNVWQSCAACVDSDDDGAFVGCDAFVTVGVDCDDGNPLSWAMCATCADLDGDGFFAGCDSYLGRAGPDCADGNPAVWASCSTCRDNDGDGYFVGCDRYVGLVAGPDCDDGEALVWLSCETCVDGDGDFRGFGCDAGGDCDDADENNWAGCATCADTDGDGRWAGCDAYRSLVRDCDDARADVWDRCATCNDADGDGYYADCNTFVTLAGPDCNDGNANAWFSCNTCRDADRDGVWGGCDAYVSVTGPDCDDRDPNNDGGCATCLDADGDGRFVGCDQYVTLDGPDCDDAAPLHWDDCATCTDLDGDGRGVGCNLGADCDDNQPGHWADCGRCADADGDRRGDSCDLGPDCNDADGDVWGTCLTCTDADGDGVFAGCDAYLNRTGPDCSDLDRNNWTHCATCLDFDGDGRWVGCDDYVTITGPDCDDADAAHWSDCGVCADDDGDGRGADCDLGDDCALGDARHWADCGLCVDVDGDDYGTACDLGLDCDDDEAAINPEAGDPTRDGIDQDCNGVDGPPLADDFEAGAVNAGVFVPLAGDAMVTFDYAHDGTYSLNLGGGGSATTVAFDTSACTAVVWTYWGKRGPLAPTSANYLAVQFFNGSTWTAVDYWYGNSTVDATFTERVGAITSLNAQHSAFQLRLAVVGTVGGSDFFVDDFRVGCDWDSDGDGRYDSFDCAPNDPQHWTDCGQCIDADLDGRGALCNRGSDCDDLDTNVWTSCATCVDTDGDGYFGTCDRYQTVFGPDCGNTNPNVWISCATCRDADGDGYWAGCDDYVTVVGPDCDDAAPLHWQDCTVCDDGDGDGRGPGCDLGNDCALADPLHWSDCGACTDNDSDGYGNGCDLGEDCDDDELTVNSGQADLTIDGIDQNCDGVDGPALFDNFDTGSLNPRVFESVTGFGLVSNLYAHSPSYALRLQGSGGTATTMPLDTSACAAVVWSYMGKRGPSAPDATDYLYLQYWNGLSWVEADRWAGTSIVDSTFSLRSGAISAAAALRADFRLRLISASSIADEDFWIDDFSFGCEIDSDGDGVHDALDCAPADRRHWSDCGACTDGDGDDYGAACDLGGDCDDDDPGINPAVADLSRDGTDQNCDGRDGPPQLDTYTSSPAVAISFGGGNATTCGFAGALVDSIVVGDAGAIDDLDVTVDITHPWVEDLDLFLEYDNGTDVVCIELSTDNGGSGDDYLGTTFDDETAVPIVFGAAPFLGRYRPESPLAALDGLPLAATYRIYVNDDVPEDDGMLNSWSVTILSNAYLPVAFFDDFEGGTSKWVLTGAWGRTTALVYNGTYALSESPSGSYTNGMNATATIAMPFSLVGASSAVLTFWHRLAIESCCDDAWVEASTNGTSWTVLANYASNITTWTQVTIPLTAYLGQPSVILRFRFSTDGSVVYDGWAIDDVTVSP